MASPLINTVLEESLISPPSGSVQDTSVSLTSFDLPWFNSPPVHRLFFYRSRHPAPSIIESLKSSLSLTLQQFYSLAGTVSLTPNSIDNKIHIHYTNGNGIRFTVAESDSDFDELATGSKRDYSTLIHPLLPQPTGLLAVQVTVFASHGICLGVTIHHVAGDGTSTTGFLKSWASACKSGALAATPSYDRGQITELPGFYSVMYNKLLQSRQDPDDQPSPSPGTRAILALFTLGRDQIDKLKKKVREQVKHIHCSTFVVSCAFAWVCLLRGQGFSNDSTVHFMFVVDCRRRLDPPIPESYFGNCLRPCIVDENFGLLNGKDGVVKACVAIGKAVEGLKDGLLKDAEGLVTKIGTIPREKLLTVAGSPKLGVYDVDFGWGKPMRVEVPSIQKTGAISLAETREGDGGIEIGIALEEGEMEKFEAQFYGGAGQSN